MLVPRLRLLVLALGLTAQGSLLRAETNAEWAQASHERHEARVEESRTRERYAEPAHASGVTGVGGYTPPAEPERQRPGAGAMSPEQIALIDDNWERMKAAHVAEVAAINARNAEIDSNQELFKQSCDGVQLMKGKIPSDPDFLRGLAMIRASAQGGDRSAKLELAQLMSSAYRGVYDPAGARAILGPLSNGGDFIATSRLADMVLAGLGGPRDVRGAAELYAKVVKQSDESWCYQYTRLAKDAAGAPRYDDQALAEWCGKMADGGNADAACALAEMHLAGRGVKHDEQREAVLWLTGLENGLGEVRAEALNALHAVLARELAKTPVASQPAQRICIGLARAEDPEGMYRLGLMIMSLWVDDPKPFDRGLDLIADARRANHPAASKLNLNDAVAPNDPGERCAWLAFQATTKHDPEAAFMFATCCAEGIGRPASPTLAANWFARAAAAGHAGARTALEPYLALADQLFPEPESACTWLLGCAEAGVVGSEAIVAKRSLDPAGPDPEAVAAACLVKAAEGGDEDSRYRIIMLYPKLYRFELFGQRPDDQALPFRWARQAAIGGSADGAYDHGIDLDKQRGPAGGEAQGQAVVWWTKASDLGHSKATFALVEALRSGRFNDGKPPADIDYDDLQRRLRRLFHLDVEVVAEAASTLIAMSFAGEGCRLSRAEVRDLAERVGPSCEVSVEFCHQLIDFFEQGAADDAPDRGQSLRWLKRCAECGEGYLDRLTVAHRVLAGDGCVADPASAMDWLREAALLDYAAMLELSHRQAAGDGVEKDPQEALELLIRAAGNGYPPANLELGRRYDTADGVERDLVKAAECYEAAQSEPEASFRFGLCLEGGLGVAKDLARARACFEAAAQAGHREAKDHLATMGK